MHMYLTSKQDCIAPLQEAKDTGVGGGINTSAVYSGPGDGAGTDTNTVEVTALDVLAEDLQAEPGTIGGTDTKV
jgi:hypothetical protein